MTPAIELLKKNNCEFNIHEYAHDANHESYGLEAAEKLNIVAERVFKTLVVKLDTGKLAVGILPVDKMLSMKLIAKALGAKKAEMAGKLEVQRATGYVLGGVSPLGQKKRLATVIDLTAQQHTSIFVSAGKRGLEIELAAANLAHTTSAKFVSICAVS